MKKTITLVALLAGAVGVQAQGTVQFADYVSGFTIDIWSPNPASPSVEQEGNTATDSPVGSTVYGGVPLGGASTGAVSPSDYGNGSLWSVGVYGSTSSTTPVNLTSADLMATTTFQTIGGTGAGNVIESPAFGGGEYAGSWINLASVSMTGTATGNAGSTQLELAAWYNGGGAYASYGAAAAAGMPVGNSEIATISGLGGPNPTSPASSPTSLAGLGITSFSLTSTPEPSTIALGVIGASSFLMRLRRKK